MLPGSHSLLGLAATVLAFTATIFQDEAASSLVAAESAHGSSRGSHQQNWEQFDGSLEEDGNAVPAPLPRPPPKAVVIPRPVPGKGGSSKGRPASPPHPRPTSSSAKSAPPSSSPCIQRPEIRDLSSEELDRLFTAIKTLHAAHPPKHPSFFDDLTYIHKQQSKLTHGTPVFLPWHRFFIRIYERELMRIDPRVRVPYWDTSLDASAPEHSIIFTPEWYGGNGDVSNNNCVRDGQFATYRPRFPEGATCLRRKFNKGPHKIGSFVPPELIARMLAKSSSYDELRRAIENQPHSAVHNGIGAMFSTMFSANDPIFWLHHFNVDRWLYDWQMLENPSGKGGRWEEYNGRTNHREVTLDDVLPGLHANGAAKGPPARVRDAMGMTVLGRCIEYLPPRKALQGRQRASVATGRDSNHRRHKDSGGKKRSKHRQGSGRGGGGSKKQSKHHQGGGGGSRKRSKHQRQLHRRSDVQTTALAEEEDFDTTDPLALEHDSFTNSTIVDYAEDAYSDLNTTSTYPDATFDSDYNYVSPYYDESAPNFGYQHTNASDVEYDDVNPHYDNDAPLPSSGDRTDLLDLHEPEPIPDGYIERMNLDRDYIRAQEQETRRVCRALNQLPDYISPAALWNREGILRRMIQSGDAPKQGFYVRGLDGNEITVPVSTNGTTTVAEIKHRVARAGIRTVAKLATRPGSRRHNGADARRMRHDLSHIMGGRSGVRVMRQWVAPAVREHGLAVRDTVWNTIVELADAGEHHGHHTHGTHRHCKCSKCARRHHHHHHHRHHHHRHHHHHHHHHHHRSLTSHHGKCKAKY